MSYQLVISQGDRAVMTSVLKDAGLDASKADEVLEALLKKRHMLISGSLYYELCVGANTHGLPS